MRVAKVSHLVTRWRQLQKKPKAPNQNRTRRDSQIYEHNVFSSYWLFTKFHQWILSKIDMPESAGEVGPIKGRSLWGSLVSEPGSSGGRSNDLNFLNVEATEQLNLHICPPVTFPIHLSLVDGVQLIL